MTQTDNLIAVLSDRYPRLTISMRGTQYIIDRGEISLAAYNPTKSTIHTRLGQTTLPQPSDPHFLTKLDAIIAQLLIHLDLQGYSPW